MSTSDFCKDGSERSRVLPPASLFLILHNVNIRTLTLVRCVQLVCSHHLLGLCNHHHNQDTELFHHHGDSLCQHHHIHPVPFLPLTTVHYRLLYSQPNEFQRWYQCNPTNELNMHKCIESRLSSHDSKKFNSLWIRA